MSKVLQLFNQTILFLLLIAKFLLSQRLFMSFSGVRYRVKNCTEISCLKTSELNRCKRTVVLKIKLVKMNNLNFIVIAIVALLCFTVNCFRLECDEPVEIHTSETLMSCIIPEVDFSTNNSDTNLTDTMVQLEDFYEIKFEHSIVPRIPSTIFEEIPKLRSLRASNSSVQELQNGLLLKAKYLRKLYLDHNGIQELDDTSFQGARDLGLLDLSFNQIRIIDRGTFEELKYLSHVNLSNNQIDFVDVDLFRSNEILHVLDLSYNQLKTLELQICQVTSVYASHNMIQNFWMELVDVQQNRQYYLNFLIKIFVDHNEIASVKIDKRFKIRHLALDHNQINDLSKFEDLVPEEIEILDLSYNHLGQLKQETFRNFYNLRSLYLSHSDIQLDDDFVFVYLMNLTELDVSYNNLQHLDTKIFSNLNSIELLNVDGNNLTKFDIENLPQRVFAISLFDNAWECPYLEELFDKMRMHTKVSVPPTFNPEHLEGQEINGVGCKSVDNDKVRTENYSETDDAVDEEETNEENTGGVTVRPE